MHGRPAHRHPARRLVKRDDVVLDNNVSLANVVVERDAANDDSVATVYSVVYVTASATFTGATAGYVTQGVSTSSTSKAAKAITSASDGTTTTKASAKTTASSSEATSTASVKTTATVSPSASSSASSSASAAATTTTSASSSASSSSSVTSSSVVLSSSASSVTSSATAASATISSSASASPTAAAASSGLSSGAKGGIAFAILLAFGFIAGLTFWCMRRKKEQRQGAQRLDDIENEKRAPSPVAPPPSAHIAPEVAPVPSPPASVRTESPAPRLSIRPTSRFSLGADPEKAAASIAAAGVLQEESKQNSSADPANPFGIHAETVNNANRPVLHPSASVTSFELQGSPVPANAGQSIDAAAATVAAAEPRSATSENAPSFGMLSPTKAEFGTASAVPLIAAAVGNPAGAGAPALGEKVHRVQLEFMPTRDDELELKAGALVRIVHEYDDGWALCMTMDRSKQGVAPRTCMSKLPLKPRTNGPPNGRPMSPMGPPAIGQQKMRNVSAPRPNPNNSMVPAPLSARLPSGGAPRMRTASGPQHNSRPMSPGPSSSKPMADARARSASVGTGNNAAKPASPTNQLKPFLLSSVPSRKPVPGQAM